jgi:thiamine pyrophosphokinase
VKFLIVANGPFLSASFILSIAKDACIIALDGAANKLMRLGIKPDKILGDFDSYQEDERLLSVEKIKLLDQNFTDFQKALQFVKSDATLIHVVCALGGRLDHQQANIQALQSDYSEHCPIYLHNEIQTLEFVRDKTVHIHGNHHDYCGFFGMPAAVMIVKNGGLEYGSEAPYFLNQTQFSCSNRLIGNEGAIVEIQGEALIVYPPTFKSVE